MQCYKKDLHLVQGIFTEYTDIQLYSQEIERSKHTVDIELTDLKDQLNECRLQITEWQCQLVKSKEQQTKANIKADEEGVRKAECQKALSELKSQLAEVSKVFNYFSNIIFSNSMQCYKKDLSLVQGIFTEYTDIQLYSQHPFS
jgi:chromosome segregation ATPase